MLHVNFHCICAIYWRHLLVIFTPFLLIRLSRTKCRRSSLSCYQFTQRILKKSSPLWLQLATLKNLRGPTRERSHSNAQIVKELLNILTMIGPFGCSKYHKIFSITGLLKEHERTLIGEKPFKCSKYDKILSILATWRNMSGPTRERSHASTKIVTRASQHTHHGTRPTRERSL